MKRVLLTIVVFFLNCGNFDSYIVYIGSQKMFVPEIDTSSIVNSLDSLVGEQWKIVTIVSSGVPTDGLWIKGTNNTVSTKDRKAILLFNGSDVSFWYNNGEIQCFGRMETDFFTIDFRGYGRSIGKFDVTEESCYQDGEAAYSYLVDSLGYAPENIYLCGFSLGTGIAVELAVKYPTAGLILFSPYSSIDRASNGITGLYNVPSNWLVNTSFNNLSKIKSINQPLYIWAGKEDMLLPPEDHAQVLFEAAEQPKFLNIVPKYNHPLFMVRSYAFWRATVEKFIQM